MPESLKIALDGTQATAGLLIALAVSIASLWVVVGRPQWVDSQHFRQARRIATLIIAVGLVLIFVFWGDLDGLSRLSEIAIMGVPICLAAFAVNVALQLYGKTKAPGTLAVLAYLFSLIAYICAGSLSLSASTVMLMVSAKADEAKAASATGEGDGTALVVRAELIGERSSERVGEPIPFRSTSSQLNFGCGQTINAEARVQLPPGATLSGDVRAQWEGVNNANPQTAMVDRVGQEVVARGTIAGLPPQRFPMPFGANIENCPGGGHGELVLMGSYTASQRTQQPFQTVVSAELGADGKAVLQLPTATDIQLRTAELLILDATTSKAVVPTIVVSLTEAAVLERDGFRVVAAKDTVTVERRNKS